MVNYKNKYGLHGKLNLYMHKLNPCNPHKPYLEKSINHLSGA
jgi:hypothetical protein